MTAGPLLRRIGFHGHCMAGRDGTCSAMFMHRSAAHEDSPAHARCMIRLKQPPGRLESHPSPFSPPIPVRSSRQKQHGYAGAARSPPSPGTRFFGPLPEVRTPATPSCRFEPWQSKWWAGNTVGPGTDLPTVCLFSLITRTCRARETDNRFCGRGTFHPMSRRGLHTTQLSAATL